MPQIAVSTGSADTLECLMHRIGLPKTEYTAGAGGTGHVHVFSGGDKGGGGGVGTPEKPSMAMAPESDLNLWVDAAHLMPYDIVLLSCEGGETYNANPAALESYLNDGCAPSRRTFTTPFSGPLDTAKTRLTRRRPTGATHWPPGPPEAAATTERSTAWSIRR